MAIGEYNKGLRRFQNENQVRWTLSATDRTEFYFDYARREVVLHRLAGDPREIRRSLAESVCEPYGSSAAERMAKWSAFPTGLPGPLHLSHRCG
jgi:hypothetical protein